jgi:hypothetical protein
MTAIIVDALSQWVWALIVAGGGLLVFWFHGYKKKAEGRKEEQRRATIAREAAAEKAKITRETATKTPISKKRERVSKWEK